MAKLYAERLLPVMLPKKALVAGQYYVGACRNGNVARWDGEKFHYWRLKWGQEFTEYIMHPEDEYDFDCFVPVAVAARWEVREIPFPIQP